MARYEIQVVNGQPICWDTELNIGVGNVDTCRRIQGAGLGRVSRPVMPRITAESRFVGFMGSENASMKSNLVFLGTSALGAYAGMKFLKITSDKTYNTLIGVGLGLVAGTLINKFVK